MVSREEASSWTVAILKTKLGELGLATTGKKDELVARYVEAISASTKEELEPAAAATVVAAEPETVDENVDNEVEAAAPLTGGAKIVFPVSEVGDRMHDRMTVI